MIVVIAIIVITKIDELTANVAGSWRCSH